MQLVVPSDHVGSADGLLERRLAMPDGPMRERYRDVRDRLDDHVSYGEATSQPISTDQLDAITSDPSGFLDRLLEHDLLFQLVDAAGAAGLTAGVLSAAATLAAAGIRNRSFDSLPWQQACLSSAKAAARSLAIAGAGKILSVTAQHAVAEGAAGTLTHALGGGTLPFALAARSAYDIGVAAHGFATGRLSATEAAVSTTQAVTRGAAIWACASIGQGLIPIPVVGAVVGAVVGQVGAVMIVKGLELAVLARNRSAEWDSGYEILLLRTAEIGRSAAEDLARLHEMTELHKTAFAQVMLPRLDNIARLIRIGQTDEVLADLADITRLYAGTPLFTTMAEFDDFMDDSRSVLVLSLGATST